MAMLMPMAIERMFSGALDANYEFETLEELKNYASTSPLSYSGQILYCKENDTLYKVNNDKTDVASLGSGGGEDAVIPYIGDNGNWYVNENDTGVPATGQDGMSAYEVAVAFNGFEGTEEEWLESLKGADGAPGTPVTVKSVSESTADGGSNVVTFSDGKALTVKNGKQGSAGKTPVRGVDYYTEADKAEIVAMVIESLGGNPVFGYVDENNNIIVSGNLPDGTYAVKYEMEDGSKVNIGNLVIDTNVYYTVKNTLTNCTSNNSATQAIGGQSYSATITAKSGYEMSSIKVTMGGTDISSSAVSGGKITIANVTGNIVITAVAEEIKAKYTNILTSGDYTVDLNKRWSSSGKTYKTSNGMICIFIPIADVQNKTIRFKGFPANQSSADSKALWFTVKTDNSLVSALQGCAENAVVWTSSYLVDEGDGVYSLPVNNTTFPNIGTAANLVIDLAVGTSAITTLPDTLIMTIDEEIA